jgi:hypothetical protein
MQFVDVGRQTHKRSKENKGDEMEREPQKTKPPRRDEQLN